MSILARITDAVGERLARRRRELPLAEVRRAAEAAPRRPSFRSALEAEGTSLIAEAKAASPSKGTLCEPYDPAALARIYEEAGARAMSVLTEPDFFRGAPAHLEQAVAACRLPVLRKDFVLDAYQVWEARAWGASAVLLIVAALDDARLADLRALAEEIGIDPLVEVHDEGEAERALAAGARVVGVNNRDLATFRTDRSVTGRVAAVIGGEGTLVSESGIRSRADVIEVEASGADAVLVGEAIVTASDPAAKVRELVGGEA